MSIVSRTEPASKPALTEADYRSIAAVGHTGDDPTAEPRYLPRLMTPDQAEAYAIQTACEHTTAGASPYATKAGVYQTLYRELFGHYLQAQAELQRARSLDVDCYDDEAPEPPVPLDQAGLARMIFSAGTVRALYNS